MSFYKIFLLCTLFNIVFSIITLPAQNLTTEAVQSETHSSSAENPNNPNSTQKSQQSISSNNESESEQFTKPNPEPKQIVNIDLLHLKAEDVRLVTNKDLSFELFVRHIPGRESILITDSSIQPDGLADNYSLRSYNWHATFGDEKRILNGKLFARNPPLYFLMDSSSSEIKQLEKGSRWFHLHLPRAVLYGYPWGREGQFDITEGTWINVRTFSKKLCDYSGPFQDNPFIIKTKNPSKTPVKYPKEKPFLNLTNLCNGQFMRTNNTAAMFGFITNILQEHTGHNLDIVFVLDTTISMKNTIKDIKMDLLQHIQSFSNDSKNKTKVQRIGLILYRDYPPDKYLTKKEDFTTEFNKFQYTLNMAVAAGGYDTPEAVYEGIDTAIHKLNWKQERRILIQIGDDIPHPIPKKNITEESVIKDALAKDIRIYSVLLSNKV